MTRNEFLTKCWKYYLYLEQDFINLTRYIDIHTNNYDVFSDEVHKQLLSIGVEFENINKIINIELGINLTQNNIEGFSEWLRSQNTVFPIINIKLSKENIYLEPFKEWSNNKNYTPLPWWQAYNKIKHNRYENYLNVNFEHLLNALSSLYYCEMYLVREIGRKTNDCDVPNDISHLFIIKNWKTENEVIGFEQYSAIDADIDNLFDLNNEND